MIIKNFKEFQAWFAHRVPSAMSKDRVRRICWAAMKKGNPPPYGADWTQFLDSLNVHKLAMVDKVIYKTKELKRLCPNFRIVEDYTIDSQVRKATEQKLRKETDPAKVRILEMVARQYRFKILDSGVILAKGDTKLEVLLKSLARLKRESNASTG